MAFNKIGENLNFSVEQNILAPKQALSKFREFVKGYIVWDKNVRTSLIVSFTLAGLEDAVVVSEEMIPLMKEFNIPLVKDFREKFTGQSDAEIYSWAYDQYWDRCSKEYIVWMGGEHGTSMKPGVADWGIYKNSFFNDLSTKFQLNHSTCIELYSFLGLSIFDQPIAISL